MNIKHFALFGIISLLLASCGGERSGAPRNLDNACSILDQRPGWLQDMQKVERKWGVPVSVQMAVLYQESKFIARARTPKVYKAGIIPAGRQSSAYGYAQAIDGTWEWYKRDSGKWRARRDRFADAVEFMGWYMNMTKNRNGFALTDAYHQYLAYHEGHTGAKRKSYLKKTLVDKSGPRCARPRRALRYTAKGVQLSTRLRIIIIICALPLSMLCKHHK